MGEGKVHSYEQKMIPIDEKSRLQHIDSLRGFALFGILIVNMLSFQYGSVGYEYVVSKLSTIDHIAFSLIEWLFQGSFYPLFSILFGFGAVMIYERVIERGRPFYFLYFRRLLVLLLMGFIHLYFIWDGDILLTYAVTGFLFMFFVRMKKKTLLTFAIILAVFINLPGLLPEDEEDDYTFDTYIQLEEKVLSTGSYIDVVEHRFTTSPYDDVYFGDDINAAEQQILVSFITIFGFILIVSQTLMLFLVGGYIAKSRVLHEPFKYKSLLKKTAIIAVIFGLLLKGGMVISSHSSLEYVGYFFGGPLLSIGYIALFTLIFIKKQEGKITRSLAFTGRIALTNYIVQSLIMTTIFYGYGLGLFGKLGVVGGIFLSILVFLLQILYSTWWMKRFYFGPLEVSLRTFMYLKRQKFKKNKSKTA